LCQALSPSAPARRMSAVRSGGTRCAFSKSWRATRIRLASNDSGSSPSSTGRSSSSSRPSAGSMNFWCAIRPTVARTSARASAPAGGIFVRWSQKSSDPVLCRSVISASRRRSCSRVPLALISTSLSDGSAPRERELPSSGEPTRAEDQHERHDRTEGDEPRAVRQREPEADVDRVLRVAEQRVEAADQERTDDAAPEAPDAADDEERERDEGQ